MANRKIFPTKDASMYTLSQSMNTGLDEILEATTVIQQDSPQVSRYLLKFSQDEINSWVTSSISGSTIGTTAGVMVLADGNLVRPESYTNFETKGLTYPTSSKNKQDIYVTPLYSGSQNPNEPIYIGGSGVGLQLNLQTSAAYFKPGVSISSSLAAGSQQSDYGAYIIAPDGDYGPFSFNRGNTGALDPDTQGATVTLTVINNKFENAVIGTTALTSGASLFGSDTTTGQTPSYSEVNAATIAVLAADLIADGITIVGGSMVQGQNILGICTGAATTAMGITNTGNITLTADMVSGGDLQTGNAGIVALTSTGVNLTAASVDTGGVLYTDGNIITIPAATLDAAGFTGASGTLIITLGSTNVTVDTAENDIDFNIGVGTLEDDWGVFPITTLSAINDSQVSRGQGYKNADRLYIPSQSFSGSDDYYFELDRSNAGDATDTFEPVEHKVTMDNYAAVVTGLGMDQTLKIYPVSGSWNMGTGKYANSPVTTDGVSWTFRNYSGSAALGAIEWAVTGSMTTAADQQIISSITSNAQGTATGVPGDGSRSGTGALFSVISDPTPFPIVTVTCTTAGTGYIPGDTITITKAVLDAAAGTLGIVSGDLTFKVTTVTGFGAFSEASFSGSDTYGGGNWYTGSNVGLDVTQSRVFSYGQGIDINVDVTDTVKTWYTNSLADNTKGFPNNGFLVKQSSSKEFVDNVNFQSTFRYFSIDTNTIYPPALNLMWNDYNFATGSNIQSILETQESFVNIYNNSGTYYSESVARMRIAAIPKYPDVVFQTASLYTNNYYLPYTSSFYALKDTDTNEYVVPFDDIYTKISADDISSYFDVYMAGLEPERNYTILIKSTVGGTVKVFDEDIMFKVING